LGTIKGMREGMKPVMWAVAVAFVASLFFVGATTLRKIVRGETHGPTIVEVDGKKIGQGEFEPIFYREMRLRYQRLQRDSQRPLTEAAERDLRLATANAVLNQLVMKELVLREAERMGLRVSDEDIRVLLENNPNFQSGGEFDRRKYETFVAEQQGMTPGEFESWLRDAILMDRVFEMVSAAARVSDAEVKARFDEETETVRVAFAFLPATPDVEAQPSDGELKTYYSSHLDDYRVPQRVRIRYAFVELEKIRKETKVSDAQVKEYYERNKTVHFDAGEIHCRHILFAVKPGDPESAWEEARRKAAAAAARIRAGEDFAKLAKELSDDPSAASNGGDLGFFGRGQMDPDFEEGAFVLEEGELSGPIKSVYGYHVVKREADIPAFEDQAEEIKEMLGKQLAEDQAMATAMELAARAAGEADLAAEAGALGLKLEEPEPFAAGEPIGELGWQRHVAEEAFALDVGDVGSALPVTEQDMTGGGRLRGFVVYQLTAKLEPGPAPFDEVKDRVAADWRRDKALAALAGRADELYRRAKERGDLEGTARAFDATFGETPAFPRAVPARQLGGDYGVAAAAFDAPEGEVVGPLRTPVGFYVVKVLEKVPADPALYATRGDEYRARLLNQRRQLILAEWYRDLVARAHIKNNLSAYLGAQEKGTAERDDGFEIPFSALGY
jgi:peptidyl-prolyl cis-trans isomerase D